ncbi:MAG: DNA polymerase I, partial [Actinobacteria bacterium]|nr:DNA polymerase I [Actinomycetota bacterium]
MAKLVFLDGNSLTYRAFFALPADMANSSGQVTNAVYGFTVMLINLIRDHEPDGLVVAFDRPEPTFRHLMLPEYKAQREPTSELLVQQFPLVRNVLDVLEIPTVETIGFEADDVLATLATRAAANGDEAVIVTGDRDLYQMVSDPLIRVLYNRRGVSDYALYDEAGIKDRTGVSPARYAMYAALRGDTSDNLPGVPGVGEKTAARLINEYGDLDGIFANVDKQTPKLRENLKMFEERARTNHKAMILRKDVPIELDVTDVRWGELDASAVKNLFEELEFVSLYERLNEILQGRLPALENSYGILETPAFVEGTSEEKARFLAQLIDEKNRTLPVGWMTSPSGFLAALAIATDVKSGKVLCLNEV